MLRLPDFLCDGMIIGWSKELSREDEWLNSIDIESMMDGFKRVVSAQEEVSTTFSLSHGDLNFANIITDSKDNCWVIDWTHAGEHPLVKDFVKMENDIKFVMSKEFRAEDFENLLRFEEFILGNMRLPHPSRLPEKLAFIAQDIRFLKMYESIKVLRDQYLLVSPIKNEFKVYKMALLKYAVHNLNFDSRRKMGRV
ncbi:MAG: protein-tyrosine phosphatase [uncultured bacterium]|nr:MAG: protein-tyrosine phosphatase [uncultured bacterium]